MKRIAAHALLIPLVTLALAGCREETHPHDLLKPTDIAAAGDLLVGRDLAGTPAADMATRADMVTRPIDMTGATGDMPPPPADMLPPTDLPLPPTDLPPPTDDLPLPTDDLPLPPTDLPPPPVDMSSAADLTSSSDPAELIVLRVGDGAAALSNAAAAAFLERRKVSDGSLVGLAVALPTAVSGTNRRLTLGGTTASEGSLNRSTDGKYLVFGGYDAAVGTASVGGTTGAVINRVIGRFDAAGIVDTSTAGNFFSASTLRSVASTDGNALWAAGGLGIAYTTFGSTATPATVLSGNMRWLQIFAGQLYASSGAAAYHGLNKVGTGTPTTTATATLLNGFAAETMTSHYGFLALDRDATPGIDVIYIADDRDVTMGGGVQRWTLSGTTWKLDGTLKLGLTAGARALTGFVSGGKVVLLVTTGETPTRVVSFVDDGTALDMIASTPLATAAANTAYRGIALPPQ